MTGRSDWARAAGLHLLLPGLVVAILAGCGAQAGADVVDGQAVGPTQVVDGQTFRRLEATARDKWLRTNGGPAPTGYEIHSLNQGPLDFLMVVTLKGGTRHALVLHCDQVTFPAAGSCS